MGSDKTHAIYAQCQMVYAGHTAEEVLGAAIMSLASAVGYLASDKANADSILHSVATDLRNQVDLNWDDLQTLKAQAGDVHRTLATA